MQHIVIDDIVFNLSDDGLDILIRNEYEIEYLNGDSVANSSEDLYITTFIGGEVRKFTGKIEFVIYNDNKLAHYILKNKDGREVDKRVLN